MGHTLPLLGEPAKKRAAPTNLKMVVSRIRTSMGVLKVKNLDFDLCGLIMAEIINTYIH